MRIWIAGATGALGRRLVRLLVQAGHDVTGATRSPQHAEQLSSAGATAIIVDALDRNAVVGAIRKASPDIVVHQLTSIPAALDLRHFDREFAATNRLRTEGLDNLIQGALGAGCRRIVAQSFAGWPFARTGGPVKSEEDPLDLNPPAKMRATLEALRELEHKVTSTPGIDGIVLRYGNFYGPGNMLGEGGSMLGAVRKASIPIIGDGAGIWSFIHIDDAAQATAAAIEQGKPGIYQVVDDEPAPVAEWLPALAKAVGAKPPMRIPAWLGRLALGEHGVVMMTKVRGASNAKAKRELGWTPRWRSWRDGFKHGLAEQAVGKKAG